MTDIDLSLKGTQNLNLSLPSSPIGNILTSDVYNGGQIYNTMQYNNIKKFTIISLSIDWVRLNVPPNTL